MQWAGEVLRTWRDATLWYPADMLNQVNHFLGVLLAGIASAGQIHYRWTAALAAAGLLAACQGSAIRDTTHDNAPTSAESGPLGASQRKVSESRGVDGISEVLIETRNGMVEVTGSPSATKVEVDAELTVRDAVAATRVVEQIQLVAETAPTRPEQLHIRPEFPRVKGILGAKLRIRLPARLKVIVKARESAVIVVRTSADVAVDTTNGNIGLTDIGGSAEARSFTGAIQGLRINGNVDFTTKDGDIKLETFGGKVQLRTTGGANGGLISVIHKAPPEPLEIDAATSNRELFVKLPGTIKAKLDFRADGGEVLTKNFDPDKLDIQGRVSSRHVLKCQLNGGGEGLIRLASTNGIVRFEIRDLTEPVK
jgi:hypothetical protein